MRQGKRLMQKAPIAGLATMISREYTVCYNFYVRKLDSHIYISFSFDLGLEMFDVDVTALKEPATKRIFCAWLKDWENSYLEQSDCVAKASLLAKYKKSLLY